ncbi:MAG TPA: acetyl-CoA hydrolase/transferase C-terminal domain-containing protein [Dokdonella sp.]|nr:acetyl-CoA hydrolase/transferase C-terminal domain-containing protein [Dokdonella sp.]
MRSSRQLVDIESCAGHILDACGEHVVLATPLGLGKPNRLINALYRRVAVDRRRRLTIHTALSLDVPNPSADLERRFAMPFLERQFGNDYPTLDYVAAMREDRLPVNIRVHEFYFQSGAMLRSRQAQRDYVSLNYTSVARDLAGTGINVVVQLIARRMQDGMVRYSLGCNPDVTLDLLDRIRDAGMPKPMLVGVVHEALPFLGGDADVGDGESLFDVVLDAPEGGQRLFALPRDDVDDVEYAIGLHASTLVRDGGTLQIGIGALSDAIVQALLLRQQRNVDYLEIIRGLYADAHDAAGHFEIGGADPFRAGLYGSSEMIMDGFMHLRRGGILVRRVYDDLALQRALDEGAIGSQMGPGDARILRDRGVLPARLDQGEVDRLAGLGILASGSRIESGRLRLADGESIDNEFDTAEALAKLDEHIRGRVLRGGRYLQGGFCLGSSELYRWLGALDGEDYDGLAMCRISEVNRLQRGIEALAARQRRYARFFNTCMIATALGAAASDAIEDGRVVSGVGGQHNFVAMGNELDDARSILMLRSTRRVDGRLTSNIRWNYGHTTVPRHLRDIYITEYGIADLRGRTDEECVKAMLAISDAAFHRELVEQAIAARKLPVDFAIPESWSANTKAALRARLRNARISGLLPDYPFGSDFDAVELRLLAALKWLKSASTQPARWLGLAKAAVWPGPVDHEALQRMGLANPSSLRERLVARVLAGALGRIR